RQHRCRVQPTTEQHHRWPGCRHTYLLCCEGLRATSPSNCGFAGLQRAAVTAVPVLRPNHTNVIQTRGSDKQLQAPRCVTAQTGHLVTTPAGQARRQSSAATSGCALLSTPVHRWPVTGDTCSCAGLAPRLAETTAADYAQLVTAAHNQLAAPVILIWGN